SPLFTEARGDFMEFSSITMTTVRNLATVAGLCLCGAIAIAAGDLPSNSTQDCNSTGKPKPGCLPVSGRTTPSAQQDRGPRRFTDEEIEKDKQRQKERAERAAAIPPINFGPEEIADRVKWMKEHAGITLKSNAQTLPATADGAKTSIFLDDEKYPVRSLTLSCNPPNVAAIGQPIYDSRGPNLY